MFGFIAAVVIGYFTPFLEGPVARPAAAALRKHINVEDQEIRLLAFASAMLAAGVVSALLDSGSAFWIGVGVIIGYFGARLIEAGRGILDARRADKEGR